MKVKIRLKLSGLSCVGCVANVKAALEAAGAEEVKVSLDKAEFLGDKERVENFIKAVLKASYGAELDN